MPTENTVIIFVFHFIQSHIHKSKYVNIIST